MNYIYDITLNFNEEPYNFYEWNEEDNIEYYIKVPVFKVEDEVLHDFIKNKILVSKNFLNKIYNKTEIYGKKNKNSKYVAIFTSLDSSIAIEFNDNGDSYLKSYLSIEEETDLLEFSKLLKYSLVDYKVKEYRKSTFKRLTRQEFSMKNSLLNNLEKIYKNNEIYKLRYLFYELYNEKPSSDEKIYSKLINLIENNSEKLYKIDSIFKNIKSGIKST